MSGAGGACPGVSAAAFPGRLAPYCRAGLARAGGVLSFPYAFGLEFCVFFCLQSGEVRMRCGGWEMFNFPGGMTYGCRFYTFDFMRCL